MNKSIIISSLIALGAATRTAILLNTIIVQPWFDKHLPNLVCKG